MLADIASGEVDWADVLFLIAAILFFLATLVAIPRPQPHGAAAYNPVWTVSGSLSSPSPGCCFEHRAIAIVALVVAVVVLLIIVL